MIPIIPYHANTLDKICGKLDKKVLWKFNLLGSQIIEIHQNQSKIQFFRSVMQNLIETFNNNKNWNPSPSTIFSQGSDKWKRKWFEWNPKPLISSSSRSIVVILTEISNKEFMNIPRIHLLPLQSKSKTYLHINLTRHTFQNNTNAHIHESIVSRIFFSFSSSTRVYSQPKSIHKMYCNLILWFLYFSVFLSRSLVCFKFSDDENTNKYFVANFSCF
jgi:hypothetical protein